MKIATIRIILFLLTLGHIYGATNSDTSGSIVTFDYDKKQFDKPLPFDEFFTFKIINLPKDKFEKINLQCWQFNKLFRGDTPKSSTKKTDPKVDLFTIEFTVNKGQTSAQKNCPYYLKPNKDYDIKLTFFEEERALTSEEVDQGNDIIKELTNTWINKYLQPNEFDYQKFNNGFVAYKEQVKEILEDSLDAQLLFKEDKAGAFSQLRLINNLNNELGGLNEHIAKLKKAIKEKNLKEPLKNLINSSKEIKLYPLKNTDEFETALKILKDSVNKMSDITERTKLKTHYLDRIETKYDKLKKKDSETYANLGNYIVADFDLISAVVIEAINSSYPPTLTEQAKDYIHADIGLAYLHRLDQVALFTTASIYFRPLKRGVPLNMYQGWDLILTRLSLDIGLTLTDVAVEGQIKGMSFNPEKENTKGMVLGLGCRVLPFAKINAGVVGYLQNDTNPLINNYTHTLSMYYGASIDTSISDIFKTIFGG